MIPNLPTGTPPYTRFGTAAIIKYCPSCAAAKPADHIWDWEVLSPSSVTSWLSYTTTFLFILFQVLFFFLPPRPCSQFSFPFFTLPWWPHPLSQLQLSLLRGWLPILYLHFWPVSQASAPQCLLNSAIWKFHQLLALSMSDLKFLIFISVEDFHHSPCKPGVPSPSPSPLPILQPDIS